MLLHPWKRGIELLGLAIQLKRFIGKHDNVRMERVSSAAHHLHTRHDARESWQCRSQTNSRTARRR
jgi:hypothetical protein